MRSLPSFVIAASLALFGAVPAIAQQVAPYTVEETGKSYTRLQDAVDAIGGGTGTIRFASMRFADCAVQKAGDITYAATVPGQSILEGVACQEKAALVLAGRSARIEGMVFSGLRVPDRNGAGIRLEKGNLTVSQSWFRDSEQGILGNNGPDNSIVIDKTSFTRLGTCEGSGGCAHSIYIGQYGSLTVTRSRFEQGTGGHYIKMRGARVSITNNSFDDSRGDETNFMIDLPNGSTGMIAHNWFVQGASKDNHSALIVIGATEKTRSSDGLTIADNVARFAPGAERSSNFVVDFSGDRIVLQGNEIAAQLKPLDRR